MAKKPKAKLIIDGRELELDIIEGTEGERAIDITRLRAETGYITMDQGYANTGSCLSNITFIDGEKGILRYRGYNIEDLCEHSTFTEVCYLLLHNRLPTLEQRENFSRLLNEHSLLHEDMRHLYNFFPGDAHPMNILGTMVNAMSSFYPNVDLLSMRDNIDMTATRLISKIRTTACYAYKKSIGEPVVYPKKELKYCENFLRMMFWSPVNNYELREDHVRALSVLLILHADHEQNCSTSTVRLVGSAHANLYASISAGISALWGPLHGGANQAVMEMLSKIQRHGGKIKKYIDMAKDKESSFRLSGFGHRVYKNYDPRAKIIKKICMKILEEEAAHQPLLDIALRLEEAVLKDEYFISRKLYPNVDFYSGLVYTALGFPTNMFTVLFAIGRMPGWIAHWKEMVRDPKARIGRPRQIYTGMRERQYVPIEERT
ncbi:MAG TPA: citrate synthase [Sedimentisphaerales bacterium]|nr:citrate synthase [Sedimentisphaerales bacterium]HRS12369.1 citrate synthase [Sedimentisphaerales bacterium]HRV48909.1 citrate synthase [Sedimentisphaerales bacterium]